MHSGNSISQLLSGGTPHHVSKPSREPVLTIVVVATRRHGIFSEKNILHQASPPSYESSLSFITYVPFSIQYDCLLAGYLPQYTGRSHVYKATARDPGRFLLTLAYNH